MRPLEASALIGAVLLFAPWGPLAPRSEALTVSPADLDKMIDAAADREGIKRPLFRALIHVESGKQATVVSNKGARGLGQIMPANAKRCGLASAQKLFDPLLNLACAAQILREEIETYGGDLNKALQSYNGGPKCIGKCKESVKYSASVLSLARRFM